MSSDKPEAPEVEPSEPADPERRRVLAALGAAAVGAAVVAPLALSVRACVPNALYEKPRRVKAGKPEAFSEGGTFLPEDRVFVFRERGALYTLSAVCTHLGCTVQLVRVGGKTEFHCPCHGSKYTADGVNFAGPAPKPLAFHPMEIAPDDGQLVLDLAETTDKTWRLKG